MAGMHATYWDFDQDASGPAALGRLLAVARGDTGRGRAVAALLLAWWDSETFGRWTLADLWRLDRAAADDMLSVITSILHRREHRVMHGLRGEFEVLIARWQPCPPAPSP